MEGLAEVEVCVQWNVAGKEKGAGAVDEVPVAVIWVGGKDRFSLGLVSVGHKNVVVDLLGRD